MTKDRIYLDYNATAPLAKKVKSFLASGLFFDANPSAQNTSGKQTKKIINQTSEFLLEEFNLSSSHDVIFHSGATEATNLFVQGCLKRSLKEGSSFHYYYSQTDHSCAFAQNDWLKHLGASCHALAVNKDGQIDFKKLLELKPKTNEVHFINLTWVNNETGIVLDLSELAKLKEIGFIIHLDAVQSVSKIDQWRAPNKDCDFISYSAHKFGALKGIGFSFVSKENNFDPLIYGGGQQNGLRSGTMNPLGIHSIKLALEDLFENANQNEVREVKSKIESLLKDRFNEQLLIVGEETKRCANTINFIITNKRADLILPIFDINGVDLSFGSACKSGSLEKSHVLIAMGLDEFADHGLRISLPFSFENKEQLVDNLKTCIQKLPL